jgi:predicted nuclease of predicted toxin-antitoxin system
VYSRFPPDAAAGQRELAVDALAAAGHDVVWIRTASPGLADPDVLARAVAEDRVLVTFDKDFGELAYHYGLPASCGVILFRLSLADPASAATLIVRTRASRADWAGHFSVVNDRRIRMRPLPPAAGP